jgi:PAS domain S-box-containing protein
MSSKAASKSSKNKMIYWLYIITTVTGLYLTTKVNYLLFHTLVELFSVIVAATVFIITWNSIKYIKNPYLITIGISFLFIGILDLLHTLTYKGMPIFTDYDYYANQLWIAARFLESCTLFAAFLLLFTNKSIRAEFVFLFYSLVTSLLIASIFYWKIFPVCFIAGKGLTDFKVYSEYVICTILIASFVLLMKNKGRFADSVYKLLLLSVACTIISELAFTFYIDNYGISNLVGHYFKLFSFIIVYHVFVATGIEEPFQLIFRELNLTNDNLNKEINSRIQIETELESEIKERKSVEVALTENNFFFKESQRAAFVGSYKTDFIADRWESSEVLDDILGIDLNYPRTVQGWLDLVHPDDREMMDTYLREEVISKKEQFSKEYRIIRFNDCETRWVHGLGEVRSDGNGIPLLLTGTIQDITERKHSEEVLQESEGQLRELADSIPNLAWWANSDGYITWYNRRWYEYTGTTPEQMEGWGWQSVHDPDELPNVLERWQACIATGEPFEMTFPLRGADNVFRPFLTRIIPLKGAAGRVHQWFGTNTDVSELEQRVADRTKDLAASINRLQNEIFERELAEKKLLEETDVRVRATEALREQERMLIQQSRQAAMGEMIGNIAHQWRQPLNTLGLYTQRLGMFYGMPSFNKEFMDNSIADSMKIIQHMSKTIDDFRDFFKPEKEKADFHVIETIKTTMSLLAGNFHNPKITVDFVEHDNPVINGYQNEFAQVFLNILNNARDAIIEREIADARVTIIIYSENSCAVVTVTDNAGGIPDEVINKVFDPYFTTKGPKVGTGIGLFMSKTIIENNMGGRLTVRNTGTGAEFRIEVEHGTQN